MPRHRSPIGRIGRIGIAQRGVIPSTGVEHIGHDFPSQGDQRHNYITAARATRIALTCAAGGWRGNRSSEALDLARGLVEDFGDLMHGLGIEPALGATAQCREQVANRAADRRGAVGIVFLVERDQPGDQCRCLFRTVRQFDLALGGDCERLARAGIDTALGLPGCTRSRGPLT